MLKIVLFLTISQHLFCETIPAAVANSEDSEYDEYIDDYGYDEYENTPEVPKNLCHLPEELNGSGDLFLCLQFCFSFGLYNNAKNPKIGT